MRSILISGVNGLLGRNLALHLVHSGQSVIGVTRSATSPQIPGVEYCTLDFASDWKTESLPTRVDTIIHLAQSANFREFPESALDVFKVNVESTARLLDYAKKADVKKFIYASSGGVYGNRLRPFQESEPIVPPGQLGYYLGSKACGEILVRSYSSVFDVVVMRPFFIYGKGQRREMLIPRLYDCVLMQKPIYLQGKNGIKINPIHVEDASAAFLATLALTNGKIYNVAGPEILSIRDIAIIIGKQLRIKPIFKNAPGTPNNLIGDITAMRKELHSPQKRFSENLHFVSNEQNIL